MPLMVVIFGWNFASGPVIYWVTQSVYSVLQQWFITGWGSLKDWVPGLWDLPEHRRLGYRPPRELDDVVVVSGEGAVQRSGFMGWMQRRVEEAQAQQQERQATIKAAKSAKSGSPPGASSSSSDDVDDPPAPAPRAPKPVKKGSTSSRAANESARSDSAADDVADAANNGHASSNGAKPRVTPKKARPARPPQEES
jgi:YidC/Oxa1 family membrane protein insertase